MAVSPTDIVFYGSASMPDNDTVLNIGGAVDTTKRVVFTDIDVAGGVEIIASGAAAMNVTVTGRNAAGEIISDTKALNGTNAVAVTGTFERLMKAVVASAHPGVTITIRKAGNAGDLMVFEPGVLEIRRIFYDAAADIPAGQGGTQRKYYEKIFSKNNHGTLSLTNSQIAEVAGGGAAKIAFALETSLNGTDTNGGGNNRRTAPGGYVFDSSTKNVANSGNHSAGASQGIWLELTLDAGDVATKTTYTLRETGQSV